MGRLVPGFVSRSKYSIDYSLLPLGVILLEFSVFATQVTNDSYSSLSALITMRLLHTFGMLVLALSVGRVLIHKKLFKLSYLASAVICTTVIALGDLMHWYLADVFEVELISFYRRIGIVVVQGILWFPALVIVLSNRKEVVESFKAYEQRLIVATRARFRGSNDFKVLRDQIQDRIQKELYGKCSSLKDSIERNISTSGEHDNALRALLVGEELRTFSRRLESVETPREDRRVFGLKTKSVSLFIQQFGILYSITVRSAPLGRRAYILVLIALVTPPYINYYSISEALITYPLLLLLIYVFTTLITRMQSAGSLRKSSIFIYLTGLLPLVSNLVGQAIFHDPQTQFPILITAFALPLTYYLFMEIFQVLRPSALRLIRNEDLKASEALQDEVTKMVTAEFSRTLSHQWAVFIHGKILTRLAATSLKFDAVVNSGDTKAFEKTAQSLIALLEAPDAEFAIEISDLQTEVSSRLNPWVGLLEIDLSIDPQLQSIKSTRVRDLGEVIEEMISNSIRHGKAKRIELKIVPAGHKDVQIIAIDNAVVAPSDNKQGSGLGTHIFNLASDGRWSITRNGSSTEFRLIMGIEA
jgi:two-component sensor histidine kinase